MASPTMPPGKAPTLSKTPTHAPKAMSSNLMTMKFMQRAAASQAQHTTLSQTPATAASTEESPPSKRRRTDTRTPDYGRAEALAAESSAPLLTDLQRMQAATAAEEARREKAIERLAAEAGETKWVLSAFVGGVVEETGVTGKGLRIVRTGYGSIDEGDEGLRTVLIGGRRSFGRFNKEIEKRQNSTVDRAGSSDESISGEEDDGEDGEVMETDNEDDPAGTRDLIQAARVEAAERAKADRKSKRKAEKQERARLTEKRKSKEVKLNRLSTISGGSGGGRDMSNIECYQCNQKGHERKDCPQKVHKGNRDGNSRKRKKSGDALDY